MNIKSNLRPEPEKILQDMIDSGEIDYGIITDGLCSTEAAQKEFDKEQKGKPPITE